MADFKPGDVVVCVDDAPRNSYMPDPEIVRGKTYRISDVVFGGVNLHRVICHGAFAFRSDRFAHLPKASDEFTVSMRALRPIKDRANA